MENKDKFDKITELTKEETERLFSEAVQNDKEKSRNNGNTTCEYDKEKGEAYLLHPDGSREYLKENDVRLVGRKITGRGGQQVVVRKTMELPKKVPKGISKRKTIQNPKRIDNNKDVRVAKRNG